ncbi:polyamine-modulated factor 1-like [Saccostrea echinata]|uniref:polyamine-modulated factor 1-like n=1 Tax=Saccostrea echinata TaxID=191078 RepID=UPI002A8200CC|nr:polyamine-modulated factor 1-like [Saccostrea echinata]
MEKNDRPGTGEEVEAVAQKDAEDIDGKRMQRLKQSLDLSLEKFYSSIKFSLFKEQLRPLYEHQPQALKKMHAQLLAQLKSNVSEEITWMLKEENIGKLLNGLNDQIDENPEKGKKGWRPSGNAAQDVLAHTAPYKLREKERLQGILSDLQSQNKLLKDALRARQTKLQHTQQRVEQKAQHWKQIDEMADRFDIDEAKKFLVKYSNYSCIR